MGDVLELSNILYVLGLKKNLLSISCKTYNHCSVSFERQECTINDSSLTSPSTLSREVREGGIYRLIFYPVVLVHTCEELAEPSTFEEAYRKKE
jgi:hypothetical protein